MDDIVVKSRRREDHVKVLRKVFERCRLFKLRMNPLKCTFGLFVGKFLGFLVHSKGIDINSAKAMAIATMKPPAMVKELKCVRLNLINHVLALFRAKFSCNFACRSPVFRWE